MRLGTVVYNFAIVSEELLESTSTTMVDTELQQQLPKIFDGKYFAASTVSLGKENRIVAKCMHCGKNISGTTTSTGNFLRHFKVNIKTRFKIC